MQPVAVKIKKQFGTGGQPKLLAALAELHRRIFDEVVLRFELNCGKRSNKVRLQADDLKRVGRDPCAATKGKRITSAPNVIAANARGLVRLLPKMYLPGSPARASVVMA